MQEGTSSIEWTTTIYHWKPGISQILIVFQGTCKFGIYPTTSVLPINTSIPIEDAGQKLTCCDDLLCCTDTASASPCCSSTTTAGGLAYVKNANFGPSNIVQTGTGQIAPVGTLAKCGKLFWVIIDKSRLAWRLSHMLEKSARVNAEISNR